MPGGYASGPLIILDQKSRRRQEGMHYFAATFNGTGNYRDPFWLEVN